MICTPPPPPLLLHVYTSVAARHISEVAAHAHTVLRPARFTQCIACTKKKKKKLFFLFTKCHCCFVSSDSRCKNARKIIADLCPCFHRSPTKLCPDLISFTCRIVTEFWSFTSKTWSFVSSTPSADVYQYPPC